MRPAHFVGREDILDRLVARLTAGGSASVSTGGMGGAGKTTLAVALAHDRRILAHFSEGVLWAALGKDPAIEQILADWAGALGLDVAAMAEPDDRALAIKNAVGLRSILFVIDDVWDEEAAGLLRCGGPNCAHLLTTRDDGIARAFAGPGATEKVPDLEPDPAFELLQALAPEVCAAEARALVTAVGGLPLAIELLGGYLGDPEHAGLAGLRTEALREMADPARRLQLARERLGGRGGERPTLEQTIELSLDDLPGEVVQAFYSLGAFAPKPDTFALAAAQVVANAEVWSFGILLKRNLIESADGERLSIHPVLGEYARSRMPAETVIRHRRAYAALLVNTSNDWRRIEQEYAQVRHSWIQWHDDPRGKVQFRFLVQEYQRLRGLWKDRIAWSEVALELAQREELKGDAAALLSGLGLAFKDLGQRQKALEYYERALPITEEVGDRQGLAVTLNNIGGVYEARGQHQKALEYFERALPIREEVGDRQGLAVTLNNIGHVYDAQGHRQQALEYFERALLLTEEVGDRQGLAVTLSNIGVVYNAQGRRQKALEHFDRALPIRDAVGDRQGLAVTLSNIGAVYDAQGQPDKALEYYERALPIMEEVGDRSGLAVMLNNIGYVYRAEGQHDKALEYYGRALSIMEEIADRPGLGRALNNIGRIHSARGQQQKALEYYERALAIQLEVGDRASEAVTRFNIGGIYHREGRLAEAVEQFRLCVALDEAVEHPDLEQDREVLRTVEAELAAASAAPPTLLDRLRRWFRRGA